MSLTSRRTVKARKRYKAEEIVAKLRQVDVLVSQGKSWRTPSAKSGGARVTYYRWRQEFAGLKTEHPAGHSRLHPVRQRTAVRRQGGTGIDRGCQCQDRLHRAGQPLGEWLHRELQRSPARELLDGEIFYTLREAQIVMESWQRHYN